MGFLSDFVGGITGSSAAGAATRGGQQLSQAALDAATAREGGITAGLTAQEGLGREGLDILTGGLKPFMLEGGDPFVSNLRGLSSDPSQQVDFLQGNPLFNALRGQAREDTFRTQSASGTLGGSGTDEILENRFLSIGNDLINQQINRQLPLLQSAQQAGTAFGTGGANILQNLGQSQLLGQQGIGEAQAGGLEQSAQALATGRIGAANARAGGVQNILGLGSAALSGGLGGGLAGAAGGIASLFSDERLKTNIEKIGSKNGINVYSWNWNDIAGDIGLTGKGHGHIAQQVQEVYPELISKHDNGYLMINYSTDKTVSLN